MKKLLTTLGSILLCACAWTQSPSAKPNILLICVDDLRTELGSYEKTEVKSPNIDRLASQSVLFEHAYCQQAVCLPSRISFHTGMRPQSTGIKDLHTRFRKVLPQAKTLAQSFQANGYETIGMGKVYHDEQPQEWSKWIDVAAITKVPEYHLDDILKAMEANADSSEALHGKEKRKKMKANGTATECADRPDSEYHDGAMTDLAISELKRLKQNPSKPFFMTVGYRKPHLPFIAPKKYWDLYNRSDLKLPEMNHPPKGAPDIALTTWGELRAYSDIPKEGPLSDEKTKELIHGYRACVSFTDAQIGRLLDTLDSLGLAQNTVIVLWGDHGWKLGEYGMWCKHTNFELDTRVPLIIKMPQGKKGVREAAFVELIDVYPTLCELIGIKAPENTEGKSILPLLKNKPSNVVPNTQQAISEYKRERKTGGDIVGYSLRNEAFRYTEWINEESRFAVAKELYDHQKDPQETVNLAKDPAYASTVEKLSKELRKQVHR